ncbi:MAG: hypothetical protein ACR2MZ_04730 [Candidatus Dormibacter sp.]|uniref:hypothetical protein n=1 Tax=Candidatus Dormibacter sp. TaxID=2973982 RepID=UPI000DB76346|nr:MAG: hypothetical protein DLM66_05400 [Candidatus Dormibacteraeota bacterium]
MGLEILLFALIVAGAAGVLAPRRKRQREPDPYEEKQRQEWAAAGQAVAHSSDLASGRLPVPYQLKVDTIRRKVQWMLSRYADRFPPGSQEHHLIGATATDYLPSTLKAYFALPPGYANWPVRPDGKTGLHVLWEQLDLLDRKLDELAHAAQRNDVDRLLANGRFLEERFSDVGRPSGVSGE